MDIIIGARIKIKALPVGTTFKKIIGGTEPIQNCYWTIVSHVKDAYGKYSGLTLCAMTTDNGVLVDTEYLNGDFETFKEMTLNEVEILLSNYKG